MPSNERHYDDPFSFDNVPLEKRYDLTIQYKDGSLAEFSNMSFIELERILHDEQEDEMEGYSIDLSQRYKKS